MEKLNPPADACPPRVGATKREIAKCATWDRVTSFAVSPLLGEWGYLHYYVFQIVDGNGERVEPYWSVYKEFADSTCSISSVAQSFVGALPDTGAHADKASA